MLISLVPDLTFFFIQTRSELHAVMTSGFSTVAGGILAAIIAVNVSATHLLSASLMSAPASLACAKLLYPGTVTVVLTGMPEVAMFTTHSYKDTCTYFPFCTSLSIFGN